LESARGEHYLRGLASRETAVGYFFLRAQAAWRYDCAHETEINLLPDLHYLLTYRQAGCSLVSKFSVK
jgi:hypothetical protein